MNRKILLSMVVFVLMTAAQVWADDRLKSAEELSNAGEFKKAVGLLKKVTKEDPSNMEAWLLLGNYSMVLGKHKNAIKAYEQVIEIDPENQAALLGLGRTYSMMRRHLSAIEAYKKVIEINPKHAEAHFDLGVSYDKMSHLTYAFEQYKILKTLDEELANKLYHIILGE
jgi:tetratricopeptide (TPR) repeat protein